MEKEKISGIQLFSLIFLFELGTALVVPLGMSAKKDAWIAILLGLAGGVCLYFIYISLSRLYQGQPLTSYIPKILGKYIGWPLGLVYVIFFTYTAARDLRDFGELLLASLYDQTPLFLIVTLMAIGMIFVLYQGIEVFARTGEIYIIILIIIGFLGNLFVLFSGIIDIKNLFPILEKGWKPVVYTAFPHTLIFPFGEMLCFTMLLPYFNKPQKALKIGLSAMLISAIILSYTISVDIAVLGVDTAGRTTFPLLTTISMVNIAEFLQRLDAIAILTLIIGNFFKVSIYFYAAVIGTSDLFKVQKQKLVWPIGMIILFFSVIIASSFSEHLKEAFSKGPMFIALTMEMGIPLLLLIIAIFRKRIRL